MNVLFHLHIAGDPTIVMIVVTVLIYLRVFLYNIGSFICYTYIDVFKYVDHFSEFFSEICKYGPFLLFLLLIVLVCCTTIV
jgi:hypothetical protein